jgi:hypothetical protein
MLTKGVLSILFTADLTDTVPSSSKSFIFTFERFTWFFQLRIPETFVEWDPNVKDKVYHPRDLEVPPQGDCLSLLS